MTLQQPWGPLPTSCQVPGPDRPKRCPLLTPCARCWARLQPLDQHLVPSLGTPQGTADTFHPPARTRGYPCDCLLGLQHLTWEHTAPPCWQCRERAASEWARRESQDRSPAPPPLRRWGLESHASHDRHTCHLSRCEVQQASVFNLTGKSPH